MAISRFGLLSLIMGLATTMHGCGENDELPLVKPDDNATNTTTLGTGPVTAYGVEEFDMAAIAGAVPTFAGVQGWSLDASINIAKDGKSVDNMGIYRNSKSVCALAFSGTNDMKDWLVNFNTKAISACGVPDMHEGFYKRMNAYLSDPAWSSSFAPLLASSSCSGGVYTVGHSMGAAVASVLAHCASKPGALPAWPSIPVAKLYTTGGPGVSKTQLTNNGGCFEGARFYNSNDATHDPVPLMPKNFYHPKMKVVKLQGDVSGKPTTMEYQCESNEALKEPVSGSGRMKLDDHSPNTYMARIASVYR
jgi:hypothetical protein